MRLLGFEIRFDLTWLILVAVVVWSLSTGLFPAAFANLPTSTYVWMGVLGAVGVFASIILHELAHSVVGRRLGLHIRGITLFAFGGAAELSEEPINARAEFWMAIAGPLMSVFLAGIFFLLSWVLTAVGAPGPIVAVVGYLVGINLILAAFNMVPAFPLDGGRVLRAALWAWRGDVAWATRVATMIGGALGLALIALGIVNAIGGDLIGGMWMVLIGMFVRAAATATYRRLLAGQLLAGIPVRRLMQTNLVTAPADLPLPQLIEGVLVQRGLKRVPVVDDDGRLLGCVGIDEVKRIPPDERITASIRDILTPLGMDATVAPDAEARAALEQMQRAGHGRLFVIEGGRLIGVLTLKDLLQYLSVKSELQAADERRRPPAPRSLHSAGE
jgi:Zn-dependent protease